MVTPLRSGGPMHTQLRTESKWSLEDFKATRLRRCVRDIIGEEKRGRAPRPDSKVCDAIGGHWHQSPALNVFTVSPNE